MAYNIKYPQTRGKNLTVALYGNKQNSPRISPSSFILGDIMLKKPSELEKLVGKWVEERRKNESPISSVDEKLLESVGKTISYFKDRIKKKKGSMSLWNIGGDNTFNKFKSGERVGKVYSARYVNSIRTFSKVKNGVAKFHDVSIAGYWGSFSDLECTCKDFQCGGALKEGETNIDFICSHIATSLIDLNENNKLYQTHKNAKDYCFVPFSARTYHEDTLSFGGIPSYNAENLDLVLLDFLYAYINTPKKALNRFELDKKLLQMPELMHRAIAEKIYDGNAGVEVLEQSFVFNKEEKMDPRLENYFGGICKMMWRNGYKMKGYVLEKAGTQWETPVLCFEKEGISKRIICSPEIPMLIITRWDLNPNEWPEIFNQECSNNHPIEELFKVKQEFDDRTKVRTNYTVEIPNIEVHDAILDDYGKSISLYYPGGMEGFGNFKKENYSKLKHIGSKLLRVATRK